MRVHQDAAQALHAEVLDESHAAHVGREVIDLHGAFHGLDGVGLLAEVHRQAFHARYALVPFRQRLAVDGADAREAQVVKIAAD